MSVKKRLPAQVIEQISLLLAVTMLPKAEKMVNKILQSSPEADVLENYELLGIIFRHFGSASKSERRTLLAMATLCRAFRRPALDRLWADLPSFIPLLLLLPQLDEHGGELVSLVSPSWW
jgi:hypothetical protein